MLIRSVWPECLSGERQRLRAAGRGRKMKSKTIGFIGLGLIGGSLAKALRRVYPELTLIGYNRSRASLVAALEDGTLNQAQDTVGGLFAACDMVFLCAPVEVNIACLRQLKGVIREDCILSDVGSVKSPIHRAVEEMGLSRQFIGGHPMAGSERSGYKNASDRLLEHAWYVLTPSPEVPESMLEEYRELTEGIGAHPVIMDPKEHDRVTAAVSHLPHVVAYALVNQVQRTDGPHGMMRNLAAGGFKDITRIASSSPDMWQQICGENREALADALAMYRESLTELEQAIREADGAYLHREFAEAKSYRDSLPIAAWATLPRSCVLSVDLVDEPGELAVVLTILGTARINVQNIELLYNRENREGVLKIYLQDEEAVRRARTLLEARNYTVYV